MKKIAFILKADSLERDDRVRKEALALMSFGYQVKIFLNFGDNIARDGITSYGIKYESVKLATREKLPSSKGLLIKAFEFRLKLLKKTQEFDIIWSHEEYSFMFPLLNFEKRKLIWDLHEFPERFNSKLGKILLRLCERGSDAIIHANKSRLDETLRCNLFSTTKKHFVLNNYPDSIFMNISCGQAFSKEVESWLSGSPYIYLQGLATCGRYPYNTISAFLRYKSNVDLKAIVVGSFEEDSKKKLESEFGDKLYEKVLFLGPIDQLDIPKYVIKALFTIVLYKADNTNNKFCEPNRLYQSLNLGIPAITGCNPTMSFVMSEKNSGIILDNDGENIESISLAIGEIMDKLAKYKLNSSLNHLEWNNDVVKDVVQSIKRS